MSAIEPVLTTRQESVLVLVSDYYRATGEPCSASYLARRLSIHHSTVRDHLIALHRKGWLRSPNTPAVPLRWLR